MSTFRIWSAMYVPSAKRGIRWYVQDKSDFHVCGFGRSPSAAVRDALRSERKARR